jgi:alpha-aminoadipate carrier protein LysW
MDERNSSWMAWREPRRTVRARCPSCQAAIALPDTIDVWDPVQCPECSAQLEMIERDPPMLDFATESGADDWEIIDLDDLEPPEDGQLV